jgi:DNA-binding response OmpR family regulator
MWIQDRDDDDDEPTYPTAALPRARVLVVEDDAPFRGLVTKRLERDGYDVYEALNGDEATKMLQFVGKIGWPTDRFEVVILDNHMPGRTGLEVLQQLRADRDPTPALLMTAYPELDVIAEANRCGAAVLVKPFSLDRLCDATIGAILSKRSLRAGVR